MKVKTILATKGTTVVTTRPDQLIREAIELLSLHNIGTLVVVDSNNRLIGIISERDIVREAAHNESFLTRSIGEVMTQAVLTGTPQDDVRSVLQTMTNKRFRHLPIIDRGNLIGIVSIGDLVKAQLEEYEGEIDTLQSQLAKGAD
jgi:CBS domain-containing protein